jgi:hypothetical protein
MWISSWSRSTSTGSTNGWPWRNLRTISFTDPDHVQRYGLEQLAGECTSAAA